jgi:hypothetical protein
MMQVSRTLRVGKGDYVEIFVIASAGTRSIVSTLGRSEFSVVGPV